MIKKLQIQYITFIMTTVTFLLSVILTGIVLSTHIIYKQESVNFLLNLPNVQNTRIIPYLSIQVDKVSNYMLVEGKYYEDSNIDFIRLIDEVNNKSSDTGIIEKYNLRYMKISGSNVDIYNFVDISGETYALKNLEINCIYAGSISFFVFLILTIILVKHFTRPVEKAWNQQKQFIGDASHELKTPLTVILTNSELLEDESSSDDDKKHYISNIHAMSLQMRSLVEQLLELARTDNGTMKNTFEPFSLSEIVETEVMIFEPSFFEKELNISSEIAENIRVYGNSDRIKQVIDIFLDNAIKYTSDKGNVRVYLKNISHSKCQLAVESDGTPLSKENIKNIFKRFYRVDKARTSSGSYGLGLSIAQNIIKEHGGNIYAKPLKGGNAFIIDLKTTK